MRSSRRGMCPDLLVVSCSLVCDRSMSTNILLVRSFTFLRSAKGHHDILTQTVERIPAWRRHAETCVPREFMPAGKGVQVSACGQGAPKCLRHAGPKQVGKKTRRKRDASEEGDGNAAVVKRAALEEMVSSYKEREERAMADAHVLRERARDATMKNRALFDRSERWRSRRRDSRDNKNC